MLYMVGQVDEFAVKTMRDYDGKKFLNIRTDEIDLSTEEQKKALAEENEAAAELFAAMKEALGDKVDQVKASTRLKTHPVCLSSGQGITFEMEKYFTAVQPELGMKAKRILEINVDHPAFAAFETARIIDPDKAKKYAEILYNQACLIAGLPIENPSAYTDLICSLWK